MIIRLLATLLAAAAVMLPQASNATEGCPRPHAIAPGRFNNSPTHWGSSDSGIISDGFIDLAQDDKHVFEVAHGVDLSHYNEIDYGKLKDCGATFAIVKLDPLYDHHVDMLKRAGIGTIPYAFFPIPGDLTRRALFSDAPEGSANLEGLLRRFADLGAGAANNLDEQLRRRGGVPDAVFAGKTVKVLAVDIEQKLSEEGSSTPQQRVAYGRAYAHALCTWLRVVREAQPSLVALLYTTPSVYGDYLRYSLAEDNACIAGLPIWLAHTTSDAGDSLYSSMRKASDIHTDQASQRLCLVNGGNRCVIHQYSHRSIFAALGANIKGIPPHTDIDRWFTTKVTDTAAGPQYVRRDDLSKPVLPPRQALALARRN